jgi:hypothetical protein
MGEEWSYKFNIGIVKSRVCYVFPSVTYSFEAISAERSEKTLSEGLVSVGQN